MSILKKVGIIEKNFYARRVYESVDDRSSKIDLKSNSGHKGLTLLP